MNIKGNITLLLERFPDPYYFDQWKTGHHSREIKPVFEVNGENKPSGLKGKLQQMLGKERM